MANTSNIAPSRLLMLYEVSNKINSQLNLKKLLDEIMDQAIALLQAEKGLILFKKDSGDLTVEVARAMDQHNIKDVLAMSHTVIEKVDKEGKSVLLQKVPDIQGGSPTESMLLYKLKSIICVPLRSRQQHIGAIYLDTTQTEHFFRDEDLIFLEAFANLAGIAIENARHYQEISPNAMDRAEIINDDVTMKTPAGTFRNCIRVEETSGLDADDLCYKTYAPGVGLIQDEDLLLTEHNSPTN